MFNTDDPGNVPTSQKSTDLDLDPDDAGAPEKIDNLFSPNPNDSLDAPNVKDENDPEDPERKKKEISSKKLHVHFIGSTEYAPEKKSKTKMEKVKERGEGSRKSSRLLMKCNEVLSQWLLLEN